MKLKILATILVFYFTASAFAQTVSLDTSAPPAEKPFEMLVIGDSIIWGQGLEDKDKFTFLTKSWLEINKFNRKRSVNMFVKAHSGASITKKNEGSLDPTIYFNGEINLWTPSITQQAKDALDCYRQPTNSSECYQNAGVSRENLSYYQGNPISPENVDLILLDGCINDMSARRIFDFSFRRKMLKAAAQQFCYGAMKELLGVLVKDYPKAKIIVTGYYPLVSKDTNPNALYDAALNAFGDNPVSDVILKAFKIFNLKPFKKFRVIRNIFAKRSSVWYLESAKGLEKAVSETNKALSEPRVFYVDPAFQYENSFSASNTYLWKLIDNTRTDDSLYAKRQDICADRRLTHFNRFDHFICHRAGLFHPNKAGAAAYYRAIANKLKEIQF
ncbi:MAG: hypothetical protein M3209_17570 [Acidobacteriota bacterium]|nr:hypothetical protein [Acidobacteriota bacterium]